MRALETTLSLSPSCATLVFWESERAPRGGEQLVAAKFAADLHLHALEDLLSRNSHRVGSVCVLDFVQVTYFFDFLDVSPDLQSSLR